MRNAFLARASRVASAAFLMLVALPARAQEAVKSKSLLETSGLNETAKSADLGSTQSTSLAGIVGNVINALLGLSGIILVVLFVYAGFLWMTAQGDEGKVKTSKLIIKNAIIGTILMFSAYIIANTVATTVLGNIIQE